MYGIVVIGHLIAKLRAMASLEIFPHHKNQSRRSTLVDLTPMVDLGFLLITFFIFTTTISEPTAMKLAFPDESGTGTSVSKEMVLTILPAANNLAVVFAGDLMDNPVLEKADLNNPTALRNLILQKQKEIVAKKRQLKDLMVIIKLGAKSTYKNLIDVLDEMQINGIKKYAVVKQSPADKLALTKALL